MAPLLSLHRDDVHTMEVEGDVAHIARHASGREANVRLGTDTFVVHDGKIAVQTPALVEPT